MPTSPRTRPLSILTQLKSRGHKHTATAPPRDQKPPPPPPKTDKMPPKLKDRGSRLQAFARGNESRAQTPNNQQSHSRTRSQDHGPPTQRGQIPDKRAPTPQAAPPPPPAQTTTRQEMVDTAKVPVPKSVRYRRDSNASSQPVSPSPPQGHPLLTGRHRADSDERQGGLFAGSQLGESFMASGLTTPHNELEESDSDAKRETKQAVPRNRHINQAHVDPSARNSDEAAFFLREDGIMTIVTGANRHDPAYLKDGFQGAKSPRSRPTEQYQHRRQLSTSPAERQTKLPLREAKRQRSRVGLEDFNGADEPRSSSPTFESTRWQAQMKKGDVNRSTMFHDLDQEVVSSIGPDEPPMTPKASKVGKAKPAAQKGLMESSMPPVMQIRKDPKDKKRRRGSLDYDDMDLSSMTYADLWKQPFDYDPARVTGQNGHELRGENQADRLERFRKQGEKEQRQMFTRMSMEDWETAGDWFVDQFTELMQKMKGARQNKRRIIYKFEAEIATREEAVRLRSEAIDRKLGRMKQDGQRVVEDRDV